MADIQIHQGKTDVSPEEAGFNPVKLEQLDVFFTELVNQKKLQCASYLLSRNGKIFAARSMGKLTYEPDSPDFMPDSIRWIASITKSVTAIAIMKLIEDGKIYLEQPVMTILEEFNTPIHNRIKIFNLLTHTSGLKGIPGYFAEPYPEDDREQKPVENWIKKVLEGPLQAEVGTEWIYCNNNYVLLGEIITRVSGMKYEDYIIENILKPLKMERTCFGIPQDKQNQTCVVLEWEKEFFIQEGPGKNNPWSSAGGINTTLYDLQKLGQMMLNQGSLNGARIVSRKTVEAMTRNQLKDIPAFYWGAKIKALDFGLGWYLRPGDLASPGTFSNEGYGRSAFYVDPAEQFIAVYFVPTNQDWIPETMINPRAFMWSGLL